LYSLGQSARICNSAISVVSGALKYVKCIKIKWKIKSTHTHTHTHIYIYIYIRARTWGQVEACLNVFGSMSLFLRPEASQGLNDETRSAINVRGGHSFALGALSLLSLSN